MIAMDDHTHFRALLRKLIDAAPGFEPTRNIKRELPSTVVVLVSATHADDPSTHDVRVADA